MRLTALLLMLAPCVVMAQDSAVDEARAEMEAGLSAFLAGDYSAFAALHPPAQLRIMTEAAGTDTEGYLANEHAKVVSSLEIVTVEHARFLPDSFTLDQTPTGRPFVRATFESYWRFDEMNLMRITAPYVALQEAGKWHVTSVQKATEIIALRMAYPDFVEVDFPESAMERIWDNTLPEGLE